MIELGGLLGLFVFGVLLALFLPDLKPVARASVAVQDDPLFQTARPAAQDDEDAIFERTLASALVVDDGPGDTQFGASGTAAFDMSDLSRIRDFVQGTDILELYYAHSDGRMDLSLDPNRAGGTDVVLNGELVAVVDNVMLMGADVVIKPKLDPVDA